MIRSAAHLRRGNARRDRRSSRVGPPEAGRGGGPAYTWIFCQTSLSARLVRSSRWPQTATFWPLVRKLYAGLGEGPPVIAFW